MTRPHETLPPPPNGRTASGNGAHPHASAVAPGVSPSPPPPPSAPAPTPRLLPLSALLGEYEDDARSRWEARTKGLRRGPVSGLSGLDEAVGGALEPGLHVLHGGPGVGKTAIALQMAAACGFPALYVTTEMRPVELLRRLTARITGTYLGRLKSGELAPEDAVAKAREAIAAAPHLGIADACDVYATPDWLREAAYAVRGEARHLLIVVDSVHTWSEMGTAEAVGLVGAGVVTEYTALDASLAALRLLAQQLACPVLGIAERNRASMLTGGLHASAGNRAFEYAGETVLSLDVTDKPTTPVGPDAKPIVLHVVKNRHGRTGDRLLLAFNGALQRFEEVAGGQERGR
jgi:replicative DNA helicase